MKNKSPKAPFQLNNWFIRWSEGEKLGLSEFPNFSSSGSISGMKKIYYGKDALLVKSGKYIYNVTSSPDIYFNI